MTDIIEVSDLCFTYPGSDKASVRNVSFNISRGEIFGFLGPSGAGKSTTQKILIGLLKDYKGAVKFDGQEVSSLDKSFYERIGVSFELPNHFLKLTAMENLSYFSSLYEKKITREEIRTTLQKVGLGDDADTKVSEFSKGMKNRLNFARSLLHAPEFYFFDEPTSGLDPVNAKNIMGIISSLRKEGKTVFLTTHDMLVADTLCDKVAFINEGKINVIDTPKSLKIKHGKKSVVVEYGNGKIESEEFNFFGLASNSRFIELMSRDDLQTIHSQEATLATVFIDMTGRTLE